MAKLRNSTDQRAGQQETILITELHAAEARWRWTAISSHQGSRQLPGTDSNWGLGPDDRDHHNAECFVCS